jgi:hypothetical protein
MITLGALSFGAGLAYAEVRRFALIAANNEGDPDTNALIFAETDAKKVQRTLTELGGYGPADVWMSLGRDRATLLTVFGELRRAIAEHVSIARAVQCSPGSVIVTAGQAVIGEIRGDGTLERLKHYGVQVVPDLCWCSISEPLFPVRTITVLTNSGKYAHYGPGLSGRKVRLGSMVDCVEAAVSGSCAPNRPQWLGN